MRVEKLRSQINHFRLFPRKMDSVVNKNGCAIKRHEETNEKEKKKTQLIEKTCNLSENQKNNQLKKGLKKMYNQIKLIAEDK